MKTTNELKMGVASIPCFDPKSFQHAVLLLPTTFGSLKIWASNLHIVCGGRGGAQIVIIMAFGGKTF
jgi:hypothetical protein